MRLSEIGVSSVSMGQTRAICVDSFGPSTHSSFRVLYFPSSGHSTIQGRASAFLRAQVKPSGIVLSSSTDHHVFSFSGSSMDISDALMVVQSAISAYETTDPRRFYSLDVEYPESLLPLIQEQVWKRNKPNWLELKSDTFRSLGSASQAAEAETVIFFRGVSKVQAKSILAKIDFKTCDSTVEAHPGLMDLRGPSKAVLNFGSERSSVILTISSPPMPRAQALAHTAALQYVYADSVSLLFTALRDRRGLCYAPRVLSHRSRTGNLVHTIFSIDKNNTDAIELESASLLDKINLMNASEIERSAENAFLGLAKWLRYSTTSGMILDFLTEIYIFSSNRTELQFHPDDILDIDILQIASEIQSMNHITKYLTIIR